MAGRTLRVIGNEVRRAVVCAGGKVHRVMAGAAGLRRGHGGLAGGDPLIQPVAIVPGKNEGLIFFNRSSTDHAEFVLFVRRDTGQKEIPSVQGIVAEELKGSAMNLVAS